LARKQKTETKKGVNTLPLYVALVALFILFIIFQNKSSLAAIFGIALFMTIVILLVIEITNGVKEEGLTRNIIEIAAAIVVVLVFWFGLKALLHTNYPLDVVPSCSMLPQLRRGDLLALHGVQNVSQIKAPIISVTSSDYQAFQNNLPNEFLACVAYQQQGGRVFVSQTIRPGYSVGLLKTTSSGSVIVPSASQGANLVQYTCGSQSILFSNGTVEQEAYTTALTINGTTIYGDKNNSIVVYQTIPSDYFYQLGDSYIVHRVYAVINVSGNYVVLTKGDNNPGLDIQYGNYPINLTYIQGKVVYSIPYLGYLKLALSNSFVEPAGCNSTVEQ
jgi:signal peptidase I